MDDLLTIANNIIFKLDQRNLELGYKFMNQQLYDEIPKFLNLLKANSNKPEYFLKLLSDINMHWGRYLSKDVSNDIQKYSILFNNLKLIELDKQRSLMELAMLHPEIIKAREDEMNILTSGLANMYSSQSELADLLNKTSISKRQTKGISKHKYPRRHKK